MCRFIAYFGQPIIVDELLFKPRNSLIRQSIHARETEEPLNGDGFGLGWYTPSINLTPAVFTSTQPAWNDINLVRLAPQIRSTCFFAHIRAASHGGVSMANCHPFQHERLLFMHNGGVGGFSNIKRSLRRSLSDPIYEWIKGQTDSEHLFALFLENWKKNNAHFTVEDMSTTLHQTIQQLNALQNKHDVKESSHLNLVISTGHNMIATRYIHNPSSSKDHARTLYYAKASEIHTIDGVCHLLNSDEGCRSILLASEKLDNHEANWQAVPENHCLQVRDDLSISLEKLDLA